MSHADLLEYTELRERARDIEFDKLNTWLTIAWWFYNRVTSLVNV